jgi:hypothetical protein
LFVNRIDHWVIEVISDAAGDIYLVDVDDLRSCLHWLRIGR